MASARYWGDENQADAVYAVYLRKVRYVPPNSYQGTTHFRCFDPDCGFSGNADHLQWETVKEKVIKAGSLGKLVECVTLSEGEMDTRHFNVLFNTYRAIASPFDVLRLILARYNGIQSEKIPMKNQKQKQTHLDSLRSVLIFWLDMFPEDFCEPPHYPCLMELVEFCRIYSPHLQDVFVKAARQRERCARDSIAGTSKCYTLEKHSSLALKLESLDYLLSPTRHQVSDVLDMNPPDIAEQLTYWDAELFKKLLPYQCQGYFWSRRHKGRKFSEGVYTVKATVDQFNALSRRVMTSVVYHDCRASIRAKRISRWIEVSKELRILKNFSSLKAVLSGLQSEPVHRLKHTWSLVPNEDCIEFQQLSRIFSSDEEDGEGARKILEKEGTAKTVNGLTLQTKDLITKNRLYRHRRSKSDMGEIQGTVPYLGTFLTDLAMIDEALSDKTEDGLINFEKRRKEFDVIAQLKLFQSAARSYHFKMEPKFRTWFQFLPCLPEKDCYRRSLEIEPPRTSTPEPTPTTAKRQIRKTTTLSKLFLSALAGEDATSLKGGSEDEWFSVVPPHSKSGGYGSLPRSSTAPPTPASTVSGVSVGKSIFYKGGSEFSPSDFFVGGGQLKKGGSKEKLTGSKEKLTGSRNSSGSNSLRGSVKGNLLTPGTGAEQDGTPHVPILKSSVSTDSRSSRNHLLNRSSVRQRTSSCTLGLGNQNLAVKSLEKNSHILRVKLDDSLQKDSRDGAMYKCIRLENGDKLSWLIEKALQKHLISSSSTQDYCLIQILDDGRKDL